MKLDLGSGKFAREGFVGVDILRLDGVGVVADLRRALPFQGDSVEELNTSHCIEHIPHESIEPFLGEIHRVCRDGAPVTIVISYYASWDGFSIGNRTFHSETWFKENSEIARRFDIEGFEFLYTPLARLVEEQFGIPPETARRLFLNVCKQMTVKLRCRKTAAPRPRRERARRPRVAFVGQPEYFRCLWEHDLDEAYEILEFDVQWEKDWTAYTPVIRFDPDIAVFFRPEMYPLELLRRIRGPKIALSSEPIPKILGGKLVSSPDMMARFASLEKARELPYDRFYHYDRTSIPYLRQNGFPKVEEFIFPVATGTYRPLGLPKKWDACFFGRDTPYRERHLGVLKRDFDVLHVAHGIGGEDFVRMVNGSKIGINLHVDEHPSLEHRMQNMLACGVMVMSDPLTHGEVLRPGEHFIEFRGPEDFRRKFEHFLANDREREEVAERGRRAVLEKLDGRRNLGGLIASVLDGVR